MASRAWSGPRPVRTYWVDFSGFPFWDRVRAAWAILRGRTFEMHGGEDYGE